MRWASPLVLLLCALAADAAWDAGSGTIRDERWPGALPLGGIGAGTIGLCTDGALCGLRDPYAGRAVDTPQVSAFFALAAGGAARMLRRPVPGEFGGTAPIEHSEAHFQWPRGTIRFHDPALPVALELQASGFLVPHDVAASSLPAVLFRLTAINLTPRPQQADIAFAPPLEAPAVTATVPLLRLPSGDGLGWWPTFAAGQAGDAAATGPYLLRLEVPAGGTAAADLVLAWPRCTPAPTSPPPLRFATVRDGLRAVFDGDPTTVWTSLRPMAPAEAVVLELAAETAVHELTVTVGAEMALSGCDVELSLDGTTWTTAAARGPLKAAAGREVAIALAPGRARFVKLVARQAPVGQHWSIAELQATGETGVAALAVAAEARLAESVDGPPAAGDDPAATAADVLANRERLLAETLSWQEPILASSLPDWIKRKLLSDAAGAVGEPPDWTAASQAFWQGLLPELPHRAPPAPRVSGPGLLPVGTGLPRAATGPVVPAGHSRAALLLAPGDADLLRGQAAALTAAHLAGFDPVPPVELDADGKPADLTAPLPEMQAWFGGPLIRLGLADDGLDLWRRTYALTWEQHRQPWTVAPLWDVPDGARPAGWAPAVSLAGWELPAALTGAALDEAAQTLRLAPVLPSGWAELRLPVYLQRCWLQIEFAPDAGRLVVAVLRHFGAPASIRAVQGAGGRVELPQPVALAAGARLDLSESIAVVQPQPRSRPAAPRRGPTNRVGRGLPTARWTARAEGHDLYAVMSSRPEMAFDGDPRTRWSTGRPMEPGDRFALDLGEPRRISKLEIEGPSRTDFPRGLKLEVSNDGLAWRELTGVELLIGDDGSVRATFAPVECRHLRLTNLGRASRLYWSIDELYLFE